VEVSPPGPGDSGLSHLWLCSTSTRGPAFREIEKPLAGFRAFKVSGTAQQNETPITGTPLLIGAPKSRRSQTPSPP
jgi:hypothetical protein